MGKLDTWCTMPRFHEPLINSGLLYIYPNIIHQRPTPPYHIVSQTDRQVVSSNFLVLRNVPLSLNQRGFTVRDTQTSNSPALSLLSACCATGFGPKHPHECSHGDMSHGGRVV